ncbi:MAG: acetyl-CoA C-acetyltransferase [Chloroflexota bacterium]|nr:acetyl-CoA C-acetyltransferase [Chloroflexota bacterium]
MTTQRREVLIVGGARTPIGKFQGTLANTPAPELGAVVVREAVKRSGVALERIEEVILGNVVGAGLGQAPARQAALKAGLKDTISATQVGKVCGSGLKAAMLASAMIRAGDADVMVAGGMENMNRGPYLLPNARFGYRSGNSEMLDATVLDGLWCAFENWHMGRAAEFIARECGITRQMQDEFSLKSHQKAIAAVEGGKFKAEIAPVIISSKKGPVAFDTDETPRADTSLEALAKLKPAFEEGGSVTAGNAPPLSDGAAAVVLVGEEIAARENLKPLARVVAYAQAGVDPKHIFWAPIYAVRKALDKAGWKLNDVDLFEINEAFAAQVLADGKELGIDWTRVNVNGGAVALGHPIGASGARVLVTLLYALKDRGLKRGVASLCLGGGEAVAMAVEVM